MSIFVNDNKLLRYLAECGKLSGIWPFDRGSEVGKFKVFIYKSFLWFYVVNCINMIVTLVMSLLHQGGLFNVVESLMELTYTLEEIVNYLYCIIRRKQLQKLLAELQRFNNTNTPYEKIVRKKYMRYVHAIYICQLVIYLVGAIAFSISPAIMAHKTLPLNISYYMLEYVKQSMWVRVLCYGLHIISIFQASSPVVLDLMIITMLWDANFRFNLLGMRMRAVFSVGQLRAVIVTHQQILSYVQSISSFSSYVIINLLIVVFCNSIICNLMILYRVPFFYLIQQFLITLISSLRLFVCSWLAEMLTDMSYNVSWCIYDIPWMYVTPTVRKSVLMIMQRCQKAVTVNATSIVPMVNIRFFGKVFCTSFSYFLTLRAILYE